jgi:predicted metal-binding membrane protein
MTASVLPRLEPAQRAVLVGSTAVVTIAAWVWLLQDPAHHGHSSVLLPTCHSSLRAVSFLPAVTMWQAMSVAMMAPTTLHWLFAYARLTAAHGERPGITRSTTTFLCGYFSVWLAYSTTAAAIQIALQHGGWLDSDGKVPTAIAGLVLVGAGVSYFTPLSRACLRHCRNPMTYFASHWRNGPRSGIRFGAAHAVYCVGCCWLLMLTGFAMGVMNMAWMAFLTILVCVEKLAPRGERIAGVAATGMILWGTALAIGKFVVGP